MARIVNVGMVGYGFMARAHSHAYRTVEGFFDLDHRPVLKAVCGRGEAAVRAFAARWGYQAVETDWRRLVERDDVDLVDVCAPNDLHCAIALAALGAGKMVLCEKPLAMNAAEALRMVEAADAAGAATMVWYNYRRVPAVALARRFVEEGRLGRTFHYRAKFLQDWTISAEVPQGGAGLWRLDVRAAGSGVTGDLLAHCIDTALWLNGPLTSVSAMTETFVKERKHVLTGRMEPVGIDDACAFLARFENGSLGTFESTRYARGHKALYTFEVNGEHGSIAWDLHDLHRLQWFDHRDQGVTRGWRSIHVTDAEHPYMKHWWVPGLAIGYEASFVHQLADFFQGLSRGEPAAPTFRDALDTQLVCDAVLKSARAGSWEEVQRRGGGAPPHHLTPTPTKNV
jgi:predicted dehydrogenase